MWTDTGTDATEGVPPFQKGQNAVERVEDNAFPPGDNRLDQHGLTSVRHRLGPRQCDHRTVTRREGVGAFAAMMEDDSIPKDIDPTHAFSARI